MQSCRESCRGLPRRQDSSVVRFGHRRVNDEHHALPGVAVERRRTPHAAPSRSGTRAFSHSRDQASNPHRPARTQDRVRESHSRTPQPGRGCPGQRTALGHTKRGTRGTPSAVAGAELARFGSPHRTGEARAVTRTSPRASSTRSGATRAERRNLHRTGVAPRAYAGTLCCAHL